MKGKTYCNGALPLASAAGLICFPPVSPLPLQGVTRYSWAKTTPRLLVPMPTGLFLADVASPSRGGGAPAMRLVLASDPTHPILDPQMSPDGATHTQPRNDRSVCAVRAFARTSPTTTLCAACNDPLHSSFISLLYSVSCFCAMVANALNEAILAHTANDARHSLSLRYGAHTGSMIAFVQDDDLMVALVDGSVPPRKLITAPRPAGAFSLFCVALVIV